MPLAGNGYGRSSPRPFHHLLTLVNSPITFSTAPLPPPPSLLIARKIRKKRKKGNFSSLPENALLENFFADVATVEAEPVLAPGASPTSTNSKDGLEEPSSNNPDNYDEGDNKVEDREDVTREAEQAAYEARFARSVLRWCNKRGVRGSLAAQEMKLEETSKDDMVTYSLNPEMDDVVINGGENNLDVVIRKKVNKEDDLKNEKSKGDRDGTDEDNDDNNKEDDDDLLLDWRGNVM
mmetsp:Transcript_43362/g.101740  ORF Transcript_43362/g.101740 Transcript_43362/m.101740 type:complete len:236 (-) Transcript_43362:164-871(-)